MEESPASDPDSSKPSPLTDERKSPDRRPFGDLGFQVSQVVERLEAGINAVDVSDEEIRPGAIKYNTGPWMEPEAMSPDAILDIVHDLVAKTDPQFEVAEQPLTPSNSLTRIVLMSHSIAALLMRLDRGHAARLGAHIAAETTQWISHLFKLGDYHAYYHLEHMEGLVKVTRMLLHHKYPRYLEDGALAIASRLPCIYCCIESPLNIVQYLCRQLGLPLACVRPVPIDASGRGMDTEALKRLCEEDIAGNRIPLLVLGEAGVPPVGCGSDIARLEAICRETSMYLHLRGHGLALAAANNRDQIFDAADALTIMPSLWFGVQGLPAITFYRIPEPLPVGDSAKGLNGISARENTLAALAGLSGGNARLPALPIWTCILASGAKRLAVQMSAAFKSARAAYTVISSVGLKILSARPGGDEPPNVGLVEAISQASACVTFQYAPPTDSTKPPPYYDKLNSWLGQVLQRETEMINIEVCETETHGVVLRYCPLEGSLLDEDRIEQWTASLEAQLHVLNATVALKEPFQEHVRKAPNLRLVHLPGWAGLGGVRYVPPGWDEASREELNSLNEKLVETLKSTDNAFSCGDGEDGMACVRFGMVMEDTDVSELLELVTTAGKEVEESSEALNNMTEVLKKGIEEAQADIERENAERAWQEGLLRRVPVVGRMVQWWAPAPNAPPPPGRRLHLALGTLQTTDDVYRNVQKIKDPEAHASTHQTTDDAPNNRGEPTPSSSQ